VKVALVGATGAVGETILRVLEERRLPVSRLSAFGAQGALRTVRFRDQELEVRPASAEELDGYDAVFFAGGEDASARYADSIVRGGSVIIDNSAAFRLQAGVALIVPEINAHAVLPGQRIFPVANCTAIVLCMALSTVKSVAGLARVQLATYQAVSGAGRAGIAEFTSAERALAASQPEPPAQIFPAAIARNVIPQIGSLDEGGYSSEEVKIRAETRKILDLPELPVSVIAVRVPVLFAHSEAVFFETQRATSSEELGQAFGRAPGVRFHPSGVVTPREVEGSDDVHVARLRPEDETGTRFSMWVAGDQLRKGAATNGVQILELLLERGVVGST